MKKNIAKVMAAILPAILLMLTGMRAVGLITIRNSSSDIANLRQIFSSPEQDFFSQLTETYQYQDSFYRKIILLVLLAFFLILCIAVRKHSIRDSVRKLKKAIRKLPDISVVRRRLTSVLDGLRNGQIADTARNYNVIMYIRVGEQEYFYAAERSAKSTVLDMACLWVLSAGGEGLCSISLPDARLIWKRNGVSLISSAKQFKIFGEDRTTNCVNVSEGEQISISNDRFTISLVVT